jgi:hypothetical protein
MEVEFVGAGVNSCCMVIQLVEAFAFSLSLIPILVHLKAQALAAVAANVNWSLQSCLHATLESVGGPKALHHLFISYY